MKLEIEDCLAEAAIYPEDFRVKVLIAGQANLWVEISAAEMISVLECALKRASDYGDDLPACKRRYADCLVHVEIGA